MITFAAICLGILTLRMCEVEIKAQSDWAVIARVILALTPALVGAAMIYGAYK